MKGFFLFALRRKSSRFAGVTLSAREGESPQSLP